MDPSLADSLVHLGGGGVLAVLIIREVLAFLRTRNGKNGVKRLGDLTVDAFESKERHIVRNELMVIVGALNLNTQKLDQIHIAIVELAAIQRERRE